MLNEINKAVECLRKGCVILYPTDTVWGLGCDTTNAQAIKRIFEIKQRPLNKSVLILVSDVNMLGRYFKNVPDILYDLEENNEKPMTYVLDDAINVDKSILHEDGSLGVRIPKNEFCRQLIKKFGKAIVSTSANISGGPNPVAYHQLEKSIIESVDLCIDPQFEKGSTGQPSSIIKIKHNGEFNFIRK